jgi:hypothetical protein
MELFKVWENITTVTITLKNEEEIKFRIRILKRHT